MPEKPPTAGPVPVAPPSVRPGASIPSQRAATGLPEGRAGPADLPGPADLKAADCALFLDLDGTLIDLAARPDAVRPDPGLPDLLHALDHRLEGALAIVTGRPVEFVETLLPANGLTLVGLHGSQFRAGTRARDLRLDPPAPDLARPGQAGPGQAGPDPVGLDRARLVVRQQAARLPGVLFEEKGAAFALHYRQAPDQAARVQAIMASAAQIAGAGFCLRPGKCVIELCPAGRDKGQALVALMAQPPFAGRRPIAAGDDLTDETMFAALPAFGGLSIGIGARPSSAVMTLPSPAALHHWLKGFLQ